jgi:hypothetical protein
MAALLALGALLGACGGGADRTKAQVRLVNASAGYSQLDLQVDGQLRQGQVPYGGSDGYVEIDPGKASSSITSAGSATTLLSFTPALSEKKYYSVLAFGAAGALRQMLLDENIGAPDTNKALLRVVNVSPDAGALDVYLTAPTDLLPNVVAVQTAVAYGVQGNYTLVNSGTWRLRITAAGSKTDVRLDVPVVVLASKQISTLVLTASKGGLMVNSLMLAQQGGIQQQDTQQARVRLVAAVTDSAVVKASLGSTSLISTAANAGEITSPSLDGYVLVPVGAWAATVTVNGQAVVVPSKTLTSGQDYSFMVHGQSAAPTSSWLVDDNRLPSDATQVKLRLINGLADSTAALAMKLDGSSVAGAVLVGAASDYTLVKPVAAGGSNGRLSITAAGVPTAIYTSASQTLIAGGSYSVFIVGPVAAPAGLVGVDR